MGASGYRGDMPELPEPPEPREPEGAPGADGAAGVREPGAAFEPGGAREPGEPRKPEEAGDSPADEPASGERTGAADTGPDAPAGLTDRDRAVLDVARRTWQHPGTKERAIRDRLGISPTRYYQLLNALIDRPEALAHDPLTVNRLRRMREARRSRR